jgi:heme exporter protein B
MSEPLASAARSAPKASGGGWRAAARAPGPAVALAVLEKDLRLDFRTRDRLGHMAVFALLVVALLSIVVPASQTERSAWSPALLWVVVLFTSLLGLARSFQSETEGGALALLVQAPVDRGWVFLGKSAATALALIGVELWTAVLFTVFLDLDWSAAWPQALGAGLLGALGLAALGTLLSAMSVAVRFREFLLPVLLFPLVLPVLVFASRITIEALAGRDAPGQLWAAFVLYDWVFALIGYFVFDYVLED